MERYLERARRRVRGDERGTVKGREIGKVFCTVTGISHFKENRLSG